MVHLYVPLGLENLRLAHSNPKYKSKMMVNMKLDKTSVLTIYQKSDKIIKDLDTALQFI